MRLLDIFDDLEGYICDPNLEQMKFVKDSFGSGFEDILGYINEYTQQTIRSYLLKLESDINSNEEKPMSKEAIVFEIEKILNKGNLTLSTKLKPVQLEYLAINKKELENFLAVLKTVSEIKQLVNIKGRGLENKHILSPTNRKRVADECKYSGRMSKTRSENNTKHIDISDCIETNLNGRDRFIFRMFDIDEAIPKYEDKIYVIVLGDPPYSH